LILETHAEYKIRLRNELLLAISAYDAHLESHNGNDFTQPPCDECSQLLFTLKHICDRDWHTNVAPNRSDAPIDTK